MSNVIDINMDLETIQGAEKLQNNIIKAVKDSVPFNSLAYLAAAANVYLAAYETHFNTSHSDNIPHACDLLYILLKDIEKKSA